MSTKMLVNEEMVQAAINQVMDRIEAENPKFAARIVAGVLQSDRGEAQKWMDAMEHLTHTAYVAMVAAA